MQTLIYYAKRNNTPVLHTSNRPIVETEKTIRTEHGTFRKSELYFYVIHDGLLNESQSIRTYFTLDNLFYYRKAILSDGSVLTYRKTEGIFKLDNKIVDKSTVENLFKQEVGL